MSSTFQERPLTKDPSPIFEGENLFSQVISTSADLDRPLVFVVDDDKDTRDALNVFFTNENYRVQTFPEAKQAIQDLRRQKEGGKVQCELIISDLVLPEMDGLELLEQLKIEAFNIPVVLVTGFGSEETAIRAVAEGAVDYIKKPFNTLELQVICDRAVRVHRLQNDYRRLKNKLSRLEKSDLILGQSPQIQKMLEQIDLISSSSSNVLISGETGSGKELVARTLHARSPRRKKPFVAINCSAFQDTLLEAELFGYSKGAFTGATVDQKGLISTVDGGTLFLDEVGDMSPALQAKLLRVIQERLVKPLGSTVWKKIDVRWISASHKDLAQAVKKKKFRDDLFYRLCVIPLHVPSLRERREDIVVLAEHFLQKFTIESEHKPKGFTKAAMAKLLSHSWPGNVRELENTIERSVVMATGFLVEERDLQMDLTETGHEADLPSWFEKCPTLKELEKKYLEFVLLKNNNRKEITAKVLGIHRKTLYRKEQEYGIQISSSGVK